MKSITRYFAIFALFSVCASSALADESTETAAHTEAVLVKALSKYVVSMNRAIYVYHWFNAGGRNQVWQSNFSANSSIGYDHVINGANRYLQAFCTNHPDIDPADCTDEDASRLSGRGNMFGPGLYASTDPIATAAYGGSRDWVLAQIRLPKKFRFVSLVWGVEDDDLPPAAQEALKNLGCSNIVKSSILQTLSEMLILGNANQGKAETNPDRLKCTSNVRRILKDRLKIEGIYYGYNATTFSPCSASESNGPGNTNQKSGNSIRQGAFVLANPKSLKPSDIKVFNNLSTEAVQDRVRITTLFYMTGPSQAKIAATISYFNQNGVPNYPNFNVQKYYYSNCDFNPAGSNACYDYYAICDRSDSSKCQVVTLALPRAPASSPSAPPAVEKISSQNLPSKFVNSFGSQLLWKDLDGLDQDPKISDWIQASLLGCADIAPFGVVPNLRYRHFAPVDPHPETAPDGK